MEANRTQFISAAFDLAEVARSAGESLRPILREREIRLVLDGVDRPLNVLGDRDKIFRVFVNLLSNAAKFTPPGRQIGVRLAPAASSVEVEVWDEGPGLTEEDLVHLFERFWQGNGPKSRGAAGSGLGLAIVKEILDHHETRIYVANRADVGAQFRFRLPRFAESPEPAPGKPPPDGRAAAVARP
jgi:signal transduction histidine kinase